MPKSAFVTSDLLLRLGELAAKTRGLTHPRRAISFLIDAMLALLSSSSAYMRMVLPSRQRWFMMSSGFDSAHFKTFGEPRAAAWCAQL